jgi:hypothetical protein
MSKAPAAKKDAKKGAEPVEVVPEVVVPKIEVGCFTFSDGSSYDGEFENREVNGAKLQVRQGKGTYSNGPEKYIGNWESDVMSGEGTYTFASGKTSQVVYLRTELNCDILCVDCRVGVHWRISEWLISR